MERQAYYLKIFVYLDESGSIHKNSKTRYFTVGGYITTLDDKNKIISLYRRMNKKIKVNRQISLNKELKSFDLIDDEKKIILQNTQNISSFYGCVKVFDKLAMQKEVVESNIFFNYAVKILFNDCILPFSKKKRIKERIEYVISIDNRNIRVGDLNNLETYLKTEFCLEDVSFRVKYYDSASNFGIQLADLIVNTFYNSFKNKEIVKDVLPVLKNSKFRCSLFPRQILKIRFYKYY
jgi:hypothetical protein